MVIIKTLLMIGLVLFLLTFLIERFKPNKVLVKWGFLFGVLFELMSLISVFHQMYPFWTDRPLWVLLILYSFVFNLIFIVSSKFNTYQYCLTLVLNILFLEWSLWLAPNMLTDGMPEVSVFLLTTHHVFASIAFALISWQLFLILSDVADFLKLSRYLSLFATMFWIAKMISFGLWAKYAWGVYWTRGEYETQYIVVLILLLLNDIWSFNISKERIPKFNYVILLGIFITIVFPVQLLIRNHGGYGL